MMQHAGVLKELSGRDTLEGSVETVLKGVRGLLGARAAAFFRRDGDVLRCTAEDAEAPRWKDRVVPLDSPEEGLVLREARPLSAPGLLRVPVPSRRPVGVLTVGWSAPRACESDDQATVEVLAEALGLQWERLASSCGGDRGQAQKMEGLGRLAGGIAHDFNNLLTSILGAAELSLGDAAPGSNLCLNLEEIRKSALRAADLTRQLLAFSRKQVLLPRVFDLARVVRDFAVILHRTLGEHIDLSTRIGPGLFRVKADPGQIEQVILNLAVNARDAMPRGGRLELEISSVEHPRDTRRALGLPPGPYVRLAMTDTGCGMNEEILRHLFEPFFTTKEIGRGTGLGLPTVYGIVKQSGGHVAVRSTPGQGSTFEVFLPEVLEPPDPEPASASGMDPAGTETILLVEDEESVRKLSIQALESLGYRVIAAADGEKAFEAARGHEVDLLVTDVVMPKVGGKELAETLIARNPELKVLFVSGYTRELLGQQGVLGPGRFFLEKPYTPRVLGVRVRRILDGDKNPSSPRGTPVPGVER